MMNESEVPALTHRTFVQAAVSELVSSVKSSADSTDRVRDRYKSETIVDNLKRVAENVRIGQPPGEAALDSRRAIGADDQHYLFSGVHLISTNPGAENYDLLPTELQPDEMRTALATGIAVGLSSYIQDGRKPLVHAAESGVGLLSLLFDLSDVRESVLETMTIAGKLSLERSREIHSAYSTPELGAAALMSLIQNKDGRAELKHMLETMDYLMHSESTPQKIANELIRINVSSNVDRVEADCFRTLNAFLLLGPNPEVNWCNQKRAAEESARLKRLQQSREDEAAATAEAEAELKNEAELREQMADSLQKATEAREQETAAREQKEAAEKREKDATAKYAAEAEEEAKARQQTADRLQQATEAREREEAVEKRVEEEEKLERLSRIQKEGEVLKKFGQDRPKLASKIEEIKEKLGQESSSMSQRDQEELTKNLKELEEALKVLNERIERLKNTSASVASSPEVVRANSMRVKGTQEGRSRGSMLLFDIAATPARSICETDAPMPDDAAPLMQDVAESALMAWREMTVGHPPGTATLNVGWTRRPNVLAFASTRSADCWKNDFLDEDWALQDGAKGTLQFTQMLDSKVGLSRVLEWASHDERGVDSSDHQYVKYCLSRGLCGMLGPHEQPISSGMDLLAYQAPRVGLPTASTHKALQSLAKRRTGLRMDSGRIGAEMNLIHDSRLIQDDQTFQRVVTDKSDMVHATARTAIAGDESALDLDSVVEGQEPSRSVRWAPVWGEGGTETRFHADFSSHSIAMAKACTFEHAIAFIKLRLVALSKDNASSNHSVTLRAVIAVLKLKQLQSLAYVASSNASSSFSSAPVSKRMKLSDTKCAKVASDKKSETDQPPLTNTNVNWPHHLLLTRPPIMCEEEDGSVMNVPFPVDCGLAVYELDKENIFGTENAFNVENVTRPFDQMNGDGFGCRNDTDTAYHKVGLLDATANLRLGLKGADVRTVDEYDGKIRTVDANVDREALDMFLGSPAHATPYMNRGSRDARAWGGFASVDSNLLKAGFMSDCIKGTMHTLGDIEKLDYESALIEKVKTSDSAVRRRIFGIQTDSNTLNRDRRSGMWQEALKEVATSSDKLLMWIRSLSGGLNEDSLSSILVGEDQELQKTSNELSKRREAAARQSSIFQTRLTESVLTSMFKSSSLGIDLANVSSVTELGEKIVIRSTEAQKQLQTALKGSNKPFFEGQVDLHNMLSQGSETLTLTQILTTLTEVGSQFHKQLMQDTVLNSELGSRLSRETLSIPRNSLMVRLNDMATAAVNDAFNELTRRLRDHYHMMIRHVYLWEMVEGPNAELCTQFNALVRAQIQKTKANDTTSSIYLNNSTKMSVNFNLEVQFQKTINVICSHVMQYSTPNFIIEDKAFLYASATPIAPGGGGKGGPSSPPSPPPPPSPTSVFTQLDANSELLRKMLTFRARRRQTRVSTFSVPSNSNSNRQIGFLGLGNSINAPIMPKEAQQIWFSNFMNQFARSTKTRTMRVFSLTASYSTLYKDTADAADTFSYTSREAEYFSNLSIREKTVLLEAARQWHERNGPSDEIIRFTGERYAPITKPSKFKRTDNGLEVYRFEFDVSRLPDEVRSDEALISRSLNLLFELPDESTTSVNDASEFYWKPASSSDWRFWYRPINVTEEGEFMVANSTFRYLYESFKDMLKSLGNWTGKNKMTAFVGLLFLALAVYKLFVGDISSLGAAMYQAIGGYMSGAWSILVDGKKILLDYAQGTLKDGWQWIMSIFNPILIEQTDRGRAANKAADLANAQGFKPGDAKKIQETIAERNAAADATSEAAEAAQSFADWLQAGAAQRNQNIQEIVRMAQ